MKLDSNEVLIFSLTYSGGKLLVSVSINNPLSMNWVKEIHLKCATWYAVWSNFNDIIIFIHTNGELDYKRFNLPFNNEFTSHSICIGSCVS